MRTIVLFLFAGCATVKSVAPGDDLAAAVAANPVVELRPGTYDTPLKLAKSVTLRGAPGVILKHVEVVSGEAEVVLEKLTIAGGSGGSGGRGGNLHVQDAKSVTLRQVVLEDGSSDHNGGGAMLVKSGTVVAEDCQMRRNRGKRAQAVLVDGPAVVTLRRCVIEGEGLLVRVVGVGELHLDQSTVEGELRVSGDAVDAPTVTVHQSKVGSIEIDAPGPQPRVLVD